MVKANIGNNKSQVNAQAWIKDVLGIKPLDENEVLEVVRSFSVSMIAGLRQQRLTGPSPMILRTLLSPCEIDPFTLKEKVVIGIDVGGTNLRLGVGRLIGKVAGEQVELIEQRGPTAIRENYSSWDNFFQFLMENGLKDLLKRYPNAPLACVFSFAGCSRRTDDGLDMIVKSLSKGWEIKTGLGQAIGQELNSFMQKRSLRKRRYLFLNDTTALITSPEIDAGLVCGSGYNWAVVVFQKQLGEGKGQAGKTIINIEAGSAFTTFLPQVVTILHQTLAESERKTPAEVPIRDEYQISGKYLGRILGIVLEGLKKEYGLFKAAKNHVFKESFIVSDILNRDWFKVENKLELLENQVLSDNEKGLLSQIAQTLRDRSAQLVAAHFIALWQTVFQNKEEVIVASDGPIIEKVPGWKEKFLGEVTRLSRNGVKLEIRQTPYKDREFRGVLDAIYHAVAYFSISSALAR
jgi:hexokinase